MGKAACIAPQLAPKDAANAFTTHFLPDTMFPSSSGPTVKFLPYDETLPGCVADARAAGADIIIALTHIGYDDDRQLAASPAAAGVDLLVGGHSHTLLWGAPQPVGGEQVAAQPPPLLVSPPTNESTVAEGPYPTLVANAAGNKTIPVVQALYASRWVVQGKRRGAGIEVGGLNSPSSAPCWGMVYCPRWPCTSCAGTRNLQSCSTPPMPAPAATWAC